MLHRHVIPLPERFFHRILLRIILNLNPIRRTHCLVLRHIPLPSPIKLRAKVRIIETRRRLRAILDRVGHSNPSFSKAAFHSRTTCD